MPTLPTMKLLHYAQRASRTLLPDGLAHQLEHRAREARFATESDAFRKSLGLRPSAHRLTVLAYPGPLVHPRIALRRICAALGYTLTSDPSRPYDLAIVHDDRSKLCPEMASGVPTRTPVLNLGAVDIDKSTVSAAFTRVFGATMDVDPTTHHGPMVEKPEENSADGRAMVVGPLEPRPDFVYQRLFDSQRPDGRFVEYRVPVHGGRVPLVYEHVAREDQRFTKRTEQTRILDASDVFTVEERAGLVELCRRLGVDYGELYVIRDRNDGVPYVIDVNKTPFGPPKDLPESEYPEALRRLTHTFERLCLDVLVAAEAPSA